jgi:outer membrane usher protein
LPAYLPSTVPIDVPDLPTGYSLGTAAFDTYAPYRGGYAVEVGSAYSVYASGKLLLANGAPLALMTGVAYPADRPEKQVALFTNAAGKFGADGLAPGTWIIDVATDDGPVHYVVEVPQGTQGLFKAGMLFPEPNA